MLAKNIVTISRNLLVLTMLLLTACTPAPQIVATSLPTSTLVVPTLSIQPTEAFIDEPVSIRLSGFEPNQVVTIRATTVGTAFPDRIDTGIVRESQATFQTDANGAVDLEKQAPLSGTYAIADGMGLFWSMEENPAKARPASSDSAPTLQNAVQYSYIFTAEVDGEKIAEATVIQTWGRPA